VRNLKWKRDEPKESLSGHGFSGNAMGVPRTFTYRNRNFSSNIDQRSSPSCYRGCSRFDSCIKSSRDLSRRVARFAVSSLPCFVLRHMKMDSRLAIHDRGRRIEQRRTLESYRCAYSGESKCAELSAKRRNIGLRMCRPSNRGKCRKHLRPMLGSWIIRCNDVDP
jgi:hypothetical protein